MSIDLSTLSLDELKQLKKDVTKAIDTFEARKKKEARDAAEAAAREHGFSLADFVSGKDSKSAAAPKYQHPENPAVTWTGRGRKPKWFVDALASGMSEADLAI